MSNFLEHYLDTEEKESKKIGDKTVRRLFGVMMNHPKFVLGGLLLSFVSTGMILLEPRILGLVVDQALIPKNSTRLIQFGVILFFVECVRFVAFTSYSYLFSALGQHVMQDLRMALFKHLHRLPNVTYDKNPAGRLLTRVTNDVSALGEMFSSGIVTIIGNFFLVLGIIVALFTLNVKLALIALSIFPVLILSSYLFSSRLKIYYRESRSKLSALNAFIAENIQGMRIVQLFNREPLHYSRYQEINESYTGAQNQTIQTFALFQPTITLLSGVAIALVLYFGGVQVQEGEIGLGVLVAFFGYVLAMFQPIRDLADKWNIFLSGVASMERIFSIMDWEVEGNKGKETPSQLRGEIEFENVWMAYHNEHYILKDLSLKIKPGMKVGIVGHTGAGKSTLIQILMRFYEFQKGEVKIDGRRIQDYDIRSLRGAFGHIQQDVFLFSGTLFENIGLWKRDRAEIEKLIEATGLDSFLNRFPQGLDTILEERGGNISQGERQVIAFLRAASQYPSIWILDEATSNIDSDTEKHLEEALKSLSQNKTRLVIAHRLATIRDADLILVLHNGKLIEFGTHTELVKKNGLYQKLLEFQRAEGLIEGSNQVV